MYLVVFSGKNIRYSVITMNFKKAIKDVRLQNIFKFMQKVKLKWRNFFTWKKRARREDETGFAVDCFVLDAL